MQVSAVLVDEFVADTSPVVRAVEYRFDRPRLVSARRLNTEGHAGPVGLLEDGSAPDVKRYPERALVWEGRRDDAFSYREPWTPGPWTLYVLFPPAGFFASVLALHGAPAGAESFTPASSGDRLFYFVLLGHASDRHSVQVDARFERDAARVEQLVAEVETVRGRRSWEAFRAPVAQSLAALGTAVSSVAAVKALFGL